MRVRHVMLQNALNGCMSVAWCLCWGGSRSTKPCFLPCIKLLQCAAGAAAIVSMRNRFSLGVLPRVVVDVCVFIGCFGICACRSECNGCMIVVTFCCHVCRDMRVKTRDAAKRIVMAA